ncbi:MAG TPA: DMT family transporter, partial [Rhodospirillales bacterium]|nr:DMT family transporter [Rhodospirillales bacterium]
MQQSGNIFFEDSPPMGNAKQIVTTAVPGIFVLLWSTGFIGARLGLPYAEPFTFLALRFAIITVLLTLIAWAWRAPWPKSLREAGHIAIVGLLIQGSYLGGVFWAISQGIPAAIAALIVGVQPVLTAVAAGPYLGEKVNARQWIGFLIGFGGVAMVVGDDIAPGSGSAIGIIACVVSLLGITLGTLYQKRHSQGMDLRTGSAIQFAVAALPMLALSLVLEDGVIEWSGEFIFALSWLIVVLSLGAMTLLYIIIRRGEASKVASLFYLVPPVVALEAWLL